jgi:NAD(P)-dependent dehydrogenase (short-subunit alcohol dehydrogenase family)
MTSDAPVCIVLGGSGAVGREVCVALVNGGAQVGFTFHRNETNGIDALGKPLDVTDVAAIDRTLNEFFEEFGRIDALVNCAAVSGAGQSETPVHHVMSEVDESTWDSMLDVNTKSSFFAVRRAAMLMRGRGGNVVLLGSIDGVKPAPSPVHYAASKAALSGMAKAMAKELGPEGIRVNVVAPGVLEGGLSRVLPAELRNEYLKHCGMKRVGRIEEVASLVVWLATKNTFVTGQTIVLDGAL